MAKKKINNVGPKNVPAVTVHREDAQGPKKPSFEERLKEKQNRQKEMKVIATRALQEWPTLHELNQALRYLEVFAQLMKLKPFLKWMIEHIEVHDQIDHKNKTIDTLVVYKGPEPIGDAGVENGEAVPEMVYDLKEAEQPLCPPKPETPERSPEQNIVRCPNCQLLFDANVDRPMIELATDIPPELKK